MNIIVNTPGDTDKKQVFTIFQNVLEKKGFWEKSDRRRPCLLGADGNERHHPGVPC